MVYKINLALDGIIESSHADISSKGDLATHEHYLVDHQIHYHY